MWSTRFVGGTAAHDLWQARKAEASKVRLVILTEARARVTFLTGFRVTQGEYRIVYAIDEKTKMAQLAGILHRDWDYRELEQISATFPGSPCVPIAVVTKQLREERGSRDEHIRQLIVTLVSPIPTVS